MAAICSSTKEKDMDMESHGGFITANALFICCVIAYDCRHFMACLIYNTIYVVRHLYLIMYRHSAKLCSIFHSLFCGDKFCWCAKFYCVRFRFQFITRSFQVELPDQRQPCGKVTADWMSHYWWALDPASWEPTDDGALGKAPVLQQDIYKKESIDNPVERGVQSKRGWSAVFSQEVKGKPLSRDYSSVYANVKHQKMKVHWGGLGPELSNTSLNNYLAHFRILKVVYKSKIVLVASWTIYVLI